MTNSSYPNWVIDEHSLSTKRVFLSVGSCQSNFAYVYEDLFKDLDITLPFTNFECEILIEMNVEPT